MLSGSALPTTLAQGYSNSAWNSTFKC